MTLIQNSNLSLSISKAVSQSVPVKQLINEGYSQTTIEGALSARILEASSLLHIGGNLSSGQPLKIAQMLIMEYPTSSLDDFSLMLQRGVTGRYGKVFGFDISVVFDWMGQFMDEWAEEKERQLAKEKNRIAQIVESEPGEWSTEFKEQFSKFMEGLQDGKMKSMPRLTRDEIRKEGQNEPPRKEAAKYIPNPENVIINQKKIEWSRKYHDILTGKPTDDWISFDEFLMGNGT